jgi:DNA-binding transcriptional ArsR family regulator
LRDIQKVLAALASPVRREILGLIWDRELSAGEIAAAFPVTKPTISQHLAVLREAGLAAATAVGTSRRYRARHRHSAACTPRSAAPASGSTPTTLPSEPRPTSAPSRWWWPARLSPPTRR